MLIFNRLHDQLQAQQQQLGSVIKQVNALIDHRVEKEKHIIKGGGKKKKKKIGGSGDAPRKERSQRTTYRSSKNGAASSRRNMNNASTRDVAPDKIIEEEDQDGSAREKQKELELLELNAIYKNEADEPESQNITNMLKLGQKLTNKKTVGEPEPFIPFVSPYTQEATRNEDDQQNVTIDEAESSNNSSSADQASSATTEIGENNRQ